MNQDPIPTNQPGRKTQQKQCPVGGMDTVFGKAVVASAERTLVLVWMSLIECGGRCAAKH